MTFFEAWTKATQRLTEKEKGRLMDALAAYATGEDAPEVLEGNEDFVYPVLRSVVDEEQAASRAKAETARMNGRKGGRPRKNPESEAAVLEEPETHENPEKPKKPKKPMGFLGFRGFSQGDSAPDIDTTEDDDESYIKYIYTPLSQVNRKENNIYNNTPPHPHLLLIRRYFGKISESEIDGIESICSRMNWSDELIERVVQCAAEYGARSPFAYIRAMASTMANVKTVEDFEAYRERRACQTRLKTAAVPPALQYEQRTYTEAELNAHLTDLSQFEDTGG